MGVSGSGKSVIGAALARALGVEFVEGDAYHSTANLERMSSGVPLTDDDRAEWLRALGLRLRQANNAGCGLVMSCSALKRSYRDTLRVEADNVRFVFLRGSRSLIEHRLASRCGHFMPSSLLDSQLATLEEPSPDENAWVCDIRQTPEVLVAALLESMAA